MTNTPLEVRTDISQVLAQIERKLDKLDDKLESKLGKIDDRLNKLDDKLESKLGKIDDRLNKLEVGQARLETDFSTLKEDIKDIKWSQKAQIWTLIGLLGTAVVGTVIRFVIQNTPNT